MSFSKIIMLNQTALRLALRSIVISLISIFSLACGSTSVGKITYPNDGFVSSNAPDKFEVSFSGAIPSGELFFLNGINVSDSFTYVGNIASANGSNLLDHMVDGDNIFRIKNAGVVLPVVFHYDNNVGPSIRIDSYNADQTITITVSDPSGISEVTLPGEDLPTTYPDLPTEVSAEIETSIGDQNIDFLLFQSVDSLGNPSTIQYARTGTTLTNSSAIQIREDMMVAPSDQLNSVASGFFERAIEKAVEFSSIEGRTSIVGSTLITISKLDPTNINIDISEIGLTANDEVYMNLDFSIEDFRFSALLDNGWTGLSVNLMAYDISFRPQVIFRKDNNTNLPYFDFDYNGPEAPLLAKIKSESYFGIFNSSINEILDSITLNMTIAMDKQINDIINSQLKRLLTNGTSGLNLETSAELAALQHLIDPLDGTKRILTFPVNTSISVLNDSELAFNQGDLFSRIETFSRAAPLPILTNPLQPEEHLKYDLAAFISSDVINQLLASLYQQVNLPEQISNGYKIKLSPGTPPTIQFDSKNGNTRIRILAENLSLLVVNIDDPNDILYDLTIDASLPVDLVITEDKKLDFMMLEDPIFKVTESVRVGPITLSNGAMDGILNFGLSPLLQKIVNLVELDIATRFVADGDFYYTTETITVAGETTDAGTKPYLVYAAYLDQNHDDGLDNTIISSAPLAACIDNSAAALAWGTELSLEYREMIRRTLLEKIRTSTVNFTRAIIDNPNTNPFVTIEAEGSTPENPKYTLVNEEAFVLALKDMQYTPINSFTEDLRLVSSKTVPDYYINENTVYEHSMISDVIDLTSLDLLYRIAPDGSSVGIRGELKNPIFDLSLKEPNSSLTYRAENITSTRLSFEITITKSENASTPDNYFYYFTLLPLRYDLTAGQIESLSCTMDYPELSTLEGIEQFSNLEYLDASFTQLTHADLTENSSLKEVILRDNRIEQIEISSNNSNLQLLDLKRNILTDNQISTFENLSGSSCGLNCELEVRLSVPAYALDKPIEDVDIPNYSAARCTASSAIKNGWLYSSEFEVFECNASIDTVNNGFVDIVGMEAFSNLKVFEVKELGDFPVFDMSIFPSLEVLKVGTNFEPSTGNEERIYPTGGFSNNEQVVLTSNPNLRVLHLLVYGASDAFLTLDLTQNSLLEDFRYYNPNYASVRDIDLSGKPSLNTIMIESSGADLILDADLSALQTLYLNDVDGPFDISSASGLEYMEVSRAELTPPIESAPNLKHLSLDSVDLTTLDLASFDNLETLRISIYQHPALNIDFSVYPALTSFFYQDRYPTEGVPTLDFSNALTLESLIIKRTEITSLDVSMLEQLIDITIEDSDLTTIDLENNALLESADLGYNDLFTSATLQYLDSIKGRSCGIDCELSITY